MFHVRDLSIFVPSPNASGSFRRLRQLDIVVNVLLGVLAVLVAFNVMALVRLRAINSQDFAEIRGITDDLSTRLIWVVSVLTVAVIAWREIHYGERTAGLMYPIVGILFVLLVPAMMTEIEPPLESHLLRVIRTECAPENMGADNKVARPGQCDPVPVKEGDILLASADPRDGDVHLIPLENASQNVAAFSFEGRGRYFVYFMIQYPDVEACENAVLFHHHYGMIPGHRNSCMQWNDAAWMVIPHETSANSITSVPLVSHTVP